MRRIIGILVATSGMALVVFGQANVQFRTHLPEPYTTPGVDAPVYLDSTNSGTKLSGTNTLWRAALLAGPTNSTPAVVDPVKGVFTEGDLSMTYNPANTT